MSTKEQFSESVRVIEEPKRFVVDGRILTEVLRFLSSCECIDAAYIESSEAIEDMQAFLALQGWPQHDAIDAAATRVLKSIAQWVRDSIGEETVRISNLDINWPSGAFDFELVQDKLCGFYWIQNCVPKRYREWLIGDLFEIITDMQDRRSSAWKIWFVIIVNIGSSILCPLIARLALAGWIIDRIRRLFQ